MTETRLSAPPERKFAPARIEAVQADGSFEGYASLFGRADLSGDIVETGAFADSLKARGAAGIRMLWQHDPNEPIGAWTEIREDGAGLFVKGQLTENVARAREVLSLMRDGAIDGLSIGYRTVASRKDAATGGRRLLKVDLWEISVVTFPMLPDARIRSVKGGSLASERDFERWLRRDAGLSRSQARTVIAKGYRALTAGRDAGGLEPAEAKALLSRIARAKRLIQS
ncbi:MAG: HK97 family phage prohead protease [Rhodobiaceae bacterium]|nr:HK97 family phage prohead protease [Rhodobiaceae bacterium]